MLISICHKSAGGFRAAMLTVALAAPSVALAQQAATSEAANASISKAPTPAKSEASRAKSEARKAEKLFNRAVRLQAEDKLDQAGTALDQTVALDPSNPGYATAREMVRQQRVSRHIDRGNQYLDEGRRVAAAGEFRAALDLDPENSFAAERLKDAYGVAPLPMPAAESPSFAAPIQLQPRPGDLDFHFRGGARQLIESIARGYGLSVSFDDSMTARTLRFDLDAVDFRTAMNAAGKATKTFYVALSATQFLVAADSQDNRRRLERMSLRTFFIPEATSPQELQDLLTMMRTLLDVRFIHVDPSSSTLTVRAPDNVLDAAGRLVSNISAGAPEVLLEIHALQLSESGNRDLGMGLPLQFTAFNLTTEARTLAATPGAQALIDQLIAGGQLSPSDAAAVLALLAAQANAGSPLLQPFATFGGGITRTGVTLPAATANFGFNRSQVQSLQKMILRAQQGGTATFRVGERYPVLTASFSPLTNIPIPANLLQRNNAQPLTPSFNYEDLGVTLKTVARISGNSDVRLEFDLALKALGATTFNGIPTIANRQYTGTITVKDNEASIIAGAITHSEQQSLQGMPWISKIPGLGRATSTAHTETTNSQLLFLIIPHVVRPARTADASQETYLGN